MAEGGKPDAQLFQLLSNLLQEMMELMSIRSESSDRCYYDGRYLPKNCTVVEKRVHCHVFGTRNGIMVKAEYAMIPKTAVESLTNQEEVELRAKIKALGLEVTKLPPKPSESLDELEIAKELDKLSAKLDDVDEMISSAVAADPEVRSLLSRTADVWMPVITASSAERRNFGGSLDAGCLEEKPEPSQQI